MGNSIHTIFEKIGISVTVIFTLRWQPRAARGLTGGYPPVSGFRRGPPIGPRLLDMSVPSPYHVRDDSSMTSPTFNMFTYQPTKLEVKEVSLSKGLTIIIFP
jgi:hypothetical protein